MLLAHDITRDMSTIVIDEDGVFLPGEHSQKGFLVVFLSMCAEQVRPSGMMNRQNLLQQSANIRNILRCSFTNHTIIR